MTSESHREADDARPPSYWLVRAAWFPVSLAIAAAIVWALVTYAGVSFGADSSLAVAFAGDIVSDIVLYGLTFLIWLLPVRTGVLDRVYAAWFGDPPA